MSSTKILVLMAVICIAVSSVSAIKCYSCLTGCNDPYSGDASHEETDCTYCSKVKSEVSGAQSVIRACATSGTATYTCSSASILGIDTDTCYCNTDLCNGSGVPAISLMALVAVSLMKFLL